MKKNEILDFFINEDYLVDTITDDTVAIEERKYAMHQILGTRKTQQDCMEIRQKDDSILAVICDGMGGLNGGKLASKLSVQILRNDYEENNLNDINGFLFNEVIKIDQSVYEMQDENGEKIAAGTTLAAVIIKNHKLYYISVGDSRIYLMRGNEIALLTEDQNYGMTLKRSLQNGTIDEEEYKKEMKYADALISYIGMGGLKVVGCSCEEALNLLPGDKILICSDGLYKSLSEEEIAGQLKECREENIEKAARDFVEFALNKSIEKEKNQDNVSVILLLEQER